MTSASSIPLSSTLRVLSQNINGFQTKITMRKRKQKRIVALGSLLRSLEVDFFAIQEPHFVTVEDRQAGVQCLSKYGYGLDGPLHEEGRGGVALAWKTSKWTLQSMKFLSPRALKASLSSGPLEITIVVVHFHHKHTRRQSQWKDIAKELHGPNLILCADHNSLVVKQRDAFAPPEFEHDTSLPARDQEVTTLAKAGLQDVWVDIHCPTLTDIKDKEASCPTGFTYGYPREGERLDPQRLRRIDRIHTTSELLSLATSVCPMFAANSDHKAILAEFTPPSFDTEDTVPRFYCPETILHDPEAMEDLETSLKSIKSTGDQWWEEAPSCIQTKAINHQREHKNKKQSVELQALRFLRGSTRDSVAPAVYQFLSPLGIAATDAATAYTLLVGVYEKAQRDRTCMETLSKLKGVITTGETSGDPRTQRNELYRLMRELQERKKLQQLVSRTGSAIRGAKAVAKELVDHWDKVSTPTGSTEEDCVAYLKSLGVEQRLRKAGQLLFKQLSLDIVHEGLKRLNSNSSPGLDGFSAKFFKRFSDIFEPQMYDSMKRFLEVGKMPETWTSGVVTMIPKTKAMQTPDSLRPIALQTTRQKWLTNILLIQLEDVLLHCIPSQQTGFLRHRSILQHVYGSRALWDGLSEGAALSVDFRNAFPTMSHEMVSAALGLMCIPFLYIRLILHLLRAPYLYSVGKGYVPGVYHHPRAATRQGDPLSQALFSLVASFVIFPLQDLGPVLTVMMYADDLIIFFDGRANPQLLKRVWEVVSRFGQLSGLKVNLNKTAAIVRNCGGMEWARCFRDIGVDVKNFVKYLGVRLGNIRHQQDDQGWGLTMEQAFAPALQEAFRRARVVSTLQLSMNERAFMLTSWILPVVAWVSKAYYAPVSVIRQLKLVYHVTMGTNSWGITLPILSRPRTQGGLALPEPELFLMHQAAAPFVSLLGDPHKFPDKAVETFYAWATAIGFTPSKDNLPYIQLGMVRTADLTFVGWSAKAHSNIQRVAPQVAPPANRDHLPLWHSVYFRNEFRCSYYNTKLIRQGVLTWGQFQSLQDARLFNALPRTWKGVYNQGGRLLNKVMSQGGFDTPAVHTQNWTRAWLLQFYASQPGVRDPQTPEVWEQLAQAQLPPRAHDFARKALRHKLTVHARVYKRSGTDKCPVCSQTETIQHAMVGCPMFKAAAAVIQHYYGQVTIDNGTSTVREMMESDDQEWLLKTNQGWAMWSARSAHWRYRCEVKAGASPVFASYLTTWLRELCEWVGFYTGEHREQWKGFQKSLEQLRDTGVQPRQGEVQVHGGLNAWWQTHTECFTQEKSADNQSWQRATESRPKRPRQAGPGVLQGVQELIAELVEKGYRIVYTDGSSKRPGHKDMRRAGGFGVFAAEDDQGPEVRFCGYVPTHYRQTNNRADLWAAVEALQGFWVPKLAIFTDSQYLQLGATGRAQHWKSKGWTTTSGKLQVHVPVWEILLQEMATPGREVRWEHVPAHVNVQGNEMANGLAMEGMCSSPLWSQHVAPKSSSGSESTVGLRGGSGSESEGTRALWSSLGMVPMDSDELTGEASGEPAPRGMGPYSSSNTESEEMRPGHTHQGVLSSALSAADTLSFSTDVSDTRRQRKKRRPRKRRNPGQGR